MALIELDFRSGALGFHEEVTVTLPDGPFTEKYPVLWLFHGANQDCTEWLRLSSIERYASKRGIAVVMPAGSNGHGNDMVYGMDYWTMINEELPCAVRALLPCLSDDPAKNFTAGASMGGYVAYKLCLNNPDKYAAAGAFGGALDIISILSGTAKDGHENLPDTFKFAFGSADNIKETAGDIIWLAGNLAKDGKCPPLWSLVGYSDFGYQQVSGACRKFKDAGAPVTDLYDEGEHSFDLWDRYVENFLDWLPLNKGGKE